MELNKIILSCRLTHNPTLDYTPNGTPVCTFGVATNKTKGSGDNRTQESYFFGCHSFNKTAETITQYLTKGSPLVIEGSLKQERWEDKEGKNRDKIRIIVDRIHFFPKNKNNNEEEKKEESKNEGW